MINLVNRDELQQTIGSGSSAATTIQENAMGCDVMILDLNGGKDALAIKDDVSIPDHGGRSSGSLTSPNANY